MLKQNYQKNPKESKLHQAVLKHKVRNLRAKVQSLLPIHFCQKIFKRNKRLNNKLLCKRLLHIHDHPDLGHHTRSLNSSSCTQTPWKYTSGYNINKSGRNQPGPMPEASYQSAKTSFHGSARQFQPGKELFFDEEFLSIGNEGQQGKGKQKKQAMINRYHFQRLTDEEIEQIDEDKLYYLGQERHIQAYDKFIGEKFMQNTTTPISNQVYKSVSKSTIALRTPNGSQSNIKLQTKTSLESQNTLNKCGSRKVKDMWSRNNSRTSSNRRENHSIMQSKHTIQDVSEHRVFRNTTNQKPAWKVNENLTRINEQEQIKRILLSMELKNKQERVEQNFKKIMNTRIQIIEQENLKEHFKILNAQQKKRKIHSEVGEIVDLTEKLRKKCIQRKTVFGKKM